MKKILFTSLMFCITLMLSAKKSAHEIVGVWDEMAITTEYYENEKLTDTQTLDFGSTSNFWDFKKNGKFVAKNGYGKKKGEWAISDNLLKIEAKKEPAQYFTIVSVSANELKLKSEEKVFDRKIATIITYRKQF